MDHFFHSLILSSLRLNNVLSLNPYRHSACRLYSGVTEVTVLQTSIEDLSKTNRLKEEVGIEVIGELPYAVDYLTRNELCRDYCALPSRVQLLKGGLPSFLRRLKSGT